MGWQGKDPATDFRGGGVLGLDNLIGLHTHFPRTFAALLHKTRGSRAEIEYPFAVAGVNISFQLMTMLGLRDPALVALISTSSTTCWMKAQRSASCAGVIARSAVSSIVALRNKNSSGTATRPAHALWPVC